MRRGVIPEGHSVLKEGMASILQRGNDVFYNEAQVRLHALPARVFWLRQETLPPPGRRRTGAHASIAFGG